MRWPFGGGGGPSHGAGVASDAHHGTQQFVAGVSNYAGTAPIPHTAAGATINGVPPWVPEVWGYYDATGELHFTSNFLGACLSRCSLRLGVLDKDNNVGPAFDEDGKPMEGVDADLAEYGSRVIASLRTAPGVKTDVPMGGQSLLLGRIGTNLGAVADCYLFGTGEFVDSASWEVVSTVEAQPVEVKPGEKQRFRRRRTRHQGATPEEFTPDFYLRIYRPHPAFSGEADSSNLPMRGVLERLVLLTAEGVADSKSRLKGPGVYWLPSEIDFPATDEDPEGEDYMTREFIETASTAIKDPTSASRHVPIVSRAPAELIDHIRHDRFDYGDGAEVERKRQAAVHDFARGTDLPFESTVGMSDTTFANAFFIDEQLARLHVVPWLELVNGFLTWGILNPALRTARGVRKNARVVPPELQKYVVWYDISGLVGHPNQEKMVQFAYGTEANPNYLISGRGARRILGVPEADRPTEDEIKTRTERSHKLRMRSEVGGDQRSDGDDGDPSPDEPGSEPDKDEEVGKRVMAMANFAIARTVDHLGSKLRSKVTGQAQRSKEPYVSALKRINGVDAADVPRVLGPQIVESLGGARTLMNGDLSTFERTVRRDFEDAGRPDAADLAAAAVKMVERVALARLFDPAVRLDVRAASEFMDLLTDGRSE